MKLKTLLLALTIFSCSSTVLSQEKEFDKFEIGINGGPSFPTSDYNTEVNKNGINAGLYFGLFFNERIGLHASYKFVSINNNSNAFGAKIWGKGGIQTDLPNLVFNIITVGPSLSIRTQKLTLVAEPKIGFVKVKDLDFETRGTLDGSNVIIRSQSSSDLDFARGVRISARFAIGSSIKLGLGAEYQIVDYDYNMAVQSNYLFIPVEDLWLSKTGVVDLVSCDIGIYYTF